jgi:transposase
LECSSVAIVDGTGKIVREAKVASDPDALIAWFRSQQLDVVRSGLEAGPLSQWLYAGMKQASLAVELLETRHVRNAFKTMAVRTDRKDARGIAELMRVGWFRPVHCKSMEAQETRAMLTARKLVQSKLRDVENSLRGLLPGFGLKVGKTTQLSFARRTRDLVRGHPCLEIIAQALLTVHAVLLREFNGFEKRVRVMARIDARAKLLMSTPAVGPIVSLTMLLPSTIRRGSNRQKQHVPTSGSRRRNTNRAKPTEAVASARSAMPRCARRSTKRPMSCSRSRSGAARSSRAGACASPSEPAWPRPRWRWHASSL